MATATATKTMRRRRPKIDIRTAVKSWLFKDDAVKKFSADKEEERKLILAYLQENGVKDSDGHYWIRWPDDPVDGRVTAIKAERHETKRLNQERAEEYLKHRRLWKQCIETVEVLDEGRIIALNWSAPGTKPTISDEDLKDLYDVTENYHFVPQRVKL